MSRLSQDLSLSKVDFNPEKFEIVVKGSSPAGITGMFLSWLKDGGVSEVVIKEAVFSSSENVYAVKLEGVYR